MSFLPGRIATVATFCVLLCASLPVAPRALAQPVEPASPETEFADAVALYEQELYAPAQRAFSTFRTRHPDHVNAGQALYLEAKSALGLDRQDAAVRLFQKLQSEYPSHPRAQEAQLSLGQYFLDQGDVERGRQQLRAVVNRSSDADQSARALYLLGTAERDAGNLSQALASFEKVSRDFPQSDVAPAALYAEGSTQIEMDRYEEAAQSFETLGARFPNSPFAQNLGTALGEVYYQLGRYDEAIQELSGRVDNLDGETQVRGLFLLAESYNQTSRPEDAIVTYRRVLDEFPQSEYRRPSLYGLAWTYRRSESARQAADTFAQVRQTATSGTDSLAVEAAYYEAVTRSDLNQPDRALSLYRTVLNSAPRHPLADDAQYEIGLLEYRRRDYSAAAAAYRALLRNFPDSPRVGDAYYWLGNAYLAQSDLDRALQAYDEAVSRDAAPDSLRREVQFQKGWAQYESGRFQAAADAFTELADAAPQSQRGQDALFWAGNSLYENGNLGRAEAFLNRYVNQTPNGRHAAAAQYSLGWTYFKRQQYNDAVRAFQNFLDQYKEIDGDIPYRQDARLRLGDSYYALKRYDEAVRVYRRVEGEGAEDYALYQAGQALNFAGRPDESIRAFRQLVDTYPNSRWQPDALYQIGFIQFQQQDYQAARDAYQRLIDQSPSPSLAARAQYGIGDTYYNAGNLQRAVDAYRAVLERFPETETAMDAASGAFFAYSAMGEESQADALIDSLAAANPNSDLVNDLRFRRAESAYQSGDEGRALQLFRQFVRTSTDEALLPQAYYYLGVIYADREQFTESQNYLRQLVDNYPNSNRLAEGALRLGDVYVERGQYQDALDAYRTTADEANAGQELQAQARYGQSVALTELGRTQEAEDLLQRLIDANQGGPLLASARLGLARIYDQTDRTGRAEDLYRTVVESSDSEMGAEGLFRLGRLLLTTGRAQDAIRELDRMGSLFPGYPEWGARALLEQARAYREMGETGQASSLYDRVLDEHAGTQWARTARQEKAAL